MGPARRSTATTSSTTSRYGTGRAHDGPQAVPRRSARRGFRPDRAADLDDGPLGRASGALRRLQLGLQRAEARDPRLERHAARRLPDGALPRSSVRRHPAQHELRGHLRPGRHLHGRHRVQLDRTGDRLRDHRLVVPLDADEDRARRQVLPRRHLHRLELLQRHAEHLACSDLRVGAAQSRQARHGGRAQDERRDLGARRVDVHLPHGKLTAEDPSFGRIPPFRGARIIRSAESRRVIVRARPWFPRLADESGVALFLALAVMVVITVMVTSVLAFTSADSRDSALKRSGQSAFALAEAGLNNAFAQLHSHYFSNSGTANNHTTVYSASWFTGAGIPTSPQSPSSTAACTSTSTCMSWGVVSWTPTGGSGIKKGTLVLRGQGRVPNPTGGTALTRTVTATIDMRQPPQLVQTPSYWSELYTGATGQPCDLQLGQGINASASIYVAGNLCLTSAASIEGSGASPVILKVLGNIRLQNGGANIGSTSRVTSVQVGGGCTKSNNGAYTSPCPINTSSTQIWDQSGRTTAPTPTPDPLPVIDWAGIAAQQAASTVSCTNGVSLSAATFYLTPSTGSGSAGYTCSITDSSGTSTLGSITYSSLSHT